MIFMAGMVLMVIKMREYQFVGRISVIFICLFCEIGSFGGINESLEDKLLLVILKKEM